MKKLQGVIALLIVCVVSTTHAQRSINVHDHLLIRDSNRYLYGLPEQKYEGSPFLDDTFVTANVYAGSGKFNPLQMRYNIFIDVMEFQDRGQTYLMEPDPRIVKIEMAERVFVVRNFKYLSKKQNGFLEQVTTGRMKLYAKKLVNHRKAMDLQGLPEKFSKLDDIFYVQVDDNPLFKVGSIKSLISELPEKQAEIEKFARDERISTKEREDLAKLASFYNSLFAPN